MKRISRRRKDTKAIREKNRDTKRIKKKKKILLSSERLEGHALSPAHSTRDPKITEKEPFEVTQAVPWFWS